MMENLGYRLLPLWEEGVLQQAKEDMERARRQAERAEERKLKLEMEMCAVEPGIWDEEWDVETCGSFEGVGKAVFGVGEHLTPALTPMGLLVGENIRSIGTQNITPETRIAFENCGMEENLVLPDRTLESFPRYVDPVMEGIGMGF